MRKICLLTILITLAGFSASASATENFTVADSLLLDINRVSMEVRDLRAQLPGLVGEDSLIIDHELKYAQIRALDKVYLLINLLADNLDNRPIRASEQDLLDAMPTIFIEAEKSAVGELKHLRTQRNEKSAHHMGQYEENVSDLMDQRTKIQDHIFTFVQAMEKLGQSDTGLDHYLQTSVKNRTRILIGRLRIALKERGALQRSIPSPATGDDALLLRAADMRVEGTVTNLRSLIALMDKMGIDTTSHETFLIESTGKLTSTDLTSGALMNFLNNWFQGMIEYLRQNGPNIFLKILMVLGILVLFRYLGKLVSRLVIASIDASRFRPSKLLRNMIENMSNRLMIVIGVLIALAQLGISLGPMLAGLGVVGFIVGFALQDTLANFASGIMILLYRPFDVGDMVETSTVYGKVKHMSLVSTTIHTIDNQTLIVPNNLIWGSVIKNVTAQNLRRVDMIFGISYSDDIPKVEKILMEILEANELVLKAPAPMVKLHELGDSSVNFVVRPWVRTDDYWDVHWDVTREVKMRFDAEGVSIPFPQQDVHLFKEKTEG